MTEMHCTLFPKVSSVKSAEEERGVRPIIQLLSLRSVLFRSIREIASGHQERPCVKVVVTLSPECRAASEWAQLFQFSKAIRLPSSSPFSKSDSEKGGAPD